MPLPIGINTELVDTLFADFGGEYRAKPVPSAANRFVADIDATFVQQVFNISKRKRKPDIHHHRQADDLRAGLEVTKGAAFCHPQKLSGPPARLNRFSSDNAHAVAL